VVEYGIGGLIKRATGWSTLFINGENETRSQYIHKVTLPQLTPGSKYGKAVFVYSYLALSQRNFRVL
jgi:hypothetical protein